MKRSLKLLQTSFLTKEDRAMIREAVDKIDRFVSSSGNMANSDITEKMDAIKASLDAEKKSVKDLNERFGMLINSLSGEREYFRKMNDIMGDMVAAIESEKNNARNMVEKFEALLSYL